MKVAEKFDQVTEHNLPEEITSDKYLNAFATKLMDLSNRLNEIDDDDTFDDAIDIKQDYLPAIREFILNITGL